MSEIKRPWLWVNSSGKGGISIDLTDEEALMRLERGDRITPLGGTKKLHDKLRAEVTDGTPTTT